MAAPKPLTGEPAPYLRVMAREDTPRLVEMMREAFGDRRASEAIWLHRYFHNPWCRMPGVVAEQDGRIVATVGRVWRPLTIDGAREVSAEGADLIVLPEYRGSGLRQRVSLQGRAEATAAGAAVCYGFANGLSRPRGKNERPYWGDALDVRRYGFVVPYYVRVLRPALCEPLLRRASPRLARLGTLPLRLQSLAPRLPAPAGGLQFREAGSVPEGTDELWEAARPQARLQATRDAAYLRWRYQDNPAERYHFLEARRGGRLVGLMVSSESEVQDSPALLVMDWLVEDRNSQVFAGLLAESLRRASDRVGLALVAAQRPFRGAVLRQGFWPLPDRMLPKAAMRYYAWEPVKEPYHIEDVIDGRNWFMTLGDSDVF